jgi:hypothetical protein
MVKVISMLGLELPRLTDVRRSTLHQHLLEANGEILRQQRKPISIRFGCSRELTKWSRSWPFLHASIAYSAHHCCRYVIASH